MLDTVSADILDAAGATADTTSDGWSVAAPVEIPGSHDQIIILKFLQDSDAATCSVEAGDNPPAVRAGLGDYSFALGASDVRYLVIEPARFLQDDGTIHIKSGDAATEVYAFALPRTVAV